jgi:uncharacterized RDD family membrane protein YckC
MTDHDDNLDPDHDFEDLADWDDDPTEGSAPLPESGPGSLAPIWARGIARIIDLFIVLAASSLVLNLTGLIEVVDDEVVSPNPLGSILVILGVWGFYEVGGTIGGNKMVGKLILGLRVRRLEADQPPAPLKVMTRWLVPAVVVLLPLGQLVFVGLIVVYLSAITVPNFQGIHDRLARTLVVRAR